MEGAAFFLLRPFEIEKSESGPRWGQVVDDGAVRRVLAGSTMLGTRRASPLGLTFSCAGLPHLGVKVASRLRSGLSLQFYWGDTMWYFLGSGSLGIFTHHR
jgi:hypothetical protein